MQVRRAESVRDMLDIFAIRRAVFNGEQGISLDREIDDTDFASGTIHFLGEDASGAIAVGRISPPHIGIPADISAMFPGIARDTLLGKLGRFAVLSSARGCGNGKELVRGAERLALNSWVRSAGNVSLLFTGSSPSAGNRVLSKAWLPASYFSRPLLDAGIEHRDLVKLVEPQASVVQFPGRWL